MIGLESLLRRFGVCAVLECLATIVEDLDGPVSLVDTDPTDDLRGCIARDLRRTSMNLRIAEGDILSGPDCEP